MHEPVGAGRPPGDAVRRRGRLSPVRHAVAAVLLVVAALVLALGASLVHGLAAEYGAETPGLGGVAVVVGVVSAGLALLCLVGARAPVGRRPRPSVLAVGVLVVVPSVLWGAQVHGGRVHERDRAAEGTACSAADRALLTAVDAPGVRSEPVGDADGGCSMLVSEVPDADVATARVAAGLQRGGWRLTGREEDEQVWQRGEAVLRVSASSDGKVTDVRLTLPRAAP